MSETRGADRGEGWSIRQGDALDVLRAMPDASVQCCVTSPPYWGLRDYGVDGQLGLEDTPEAYVARMVEVFREVRRVLREDGTLWLNLGDSYAGGTRDFNSFRRDRGHVHVPRPQIAEGLKAKDLAGIPWRVAFALQADGWWLRSDIIWAKPNPMPESVRDRPTKAHEYVFLLSKSERYFYDADAVAELASENKPWAERTSNGGAKALVTRNDGGNTYTLGKAADGTRNRRSVWTVTTRPYPEAHFAVYPPELVEPCIQAGTSERGCCPECGAPWERVVEVKADDRKRYATVHEHRTPVANPGPQKVLRDDGRGGDLPSKRRETTGWAPACDHDAPPTPCTVLDPFAGSGTTGVVALRLRRSFVGIELNPEYVELARKRIDGDCPLFNRPTEAA